MTQRSATQLGAVIVGGGIARVSAAARMRSVGYEGATLLIGDEPELPCRRPPVSKEIIRGEKTAEQIRIKPAAGYADNAVELLTGVHVTSVEPAGLLATGAPVMLDRLLLATGGIARTLDSAGIRALRTLAAAPRLHSQPTSGQHLIVVAAGLIGSEIAASRMDSVATSHSSRRPRFRCRACSRRSSAR